MVAFDTNVVVRLLLRDDAGQAKKAEQAFLRHGRGSQRISVVLAAAKEEKSMGVTIGLDVGWSERRRTCGVALRGGPLVAVGAMTYGDIAAVALNKRDVARVLRPAVQRAFDGGQRVLAARRREAGAGGTWLSRPSDGRGSATVRRRTPC